MLILQFLFCLIVVLKIINVVYIKIEIINLKPDLRNQDFRFTFMILTL